MLHLIIKKLIQGAEGNFGRRRIGLWPDGGDGFTGAHLSTKSLSCIYYIYTVFLYVNISIK